MGKVAYGFTSSIDGFIAGPGHDMGWMDAAEPLAEGSTRRMAERVAVIISGRRGYDAAIASGANTMRARQRRMAARGRALGSC